MHEASIVQALLDRVESEAQARGASAVHRVHLRLGEMSGVESDLLRAAYEAFRERGICAGAELEIEGVAARWSCPRCERPILRGEPLRCPDCEIPAHLVEGEEIILARIEMEVN
jgi:hydrogenase nickel incorporation protein HypA/HybF